MLFTEQSELFKGSPPRFLVLEGVNGAGKTTLQRKILEYFKERKIKAIGTREPGATDFGKSVRSLVLNSNRDQISERAEVFLFAADRSHHVEKVIKPALMNNEIVISDRYFYSTLAFQGYGRGFNLETIWNINKIAIDGVLPDLVVLLDLDPAKGLDRNKQEGQVEREGGKKAVKGSELHDAGTKASTKDGRDSFEEEDLSFHIRIREGFLKLAKERPEPFLVLNADEDKESIWNKLKIVLDKLYA